MMICHLKKNEIQLKHDMGLGFYVNANVYDFMSQNI